MKNAIPRFALNDEGGVKTLHDYYTGRAFPVDQGGVLVGPDGVWDIPKLANLIENGKHITAALVFNASQLPNPPRAPNVYFAYRGDHCHEPEFHHAHLNESGQKLHHCNLGQQALDLASQDFELEVELSLVQPNDILAGGVMLKEATMPPGDGVPQAVVGDELTASGAPVDPVNTPVTTSESLPWDNDQAGEAPAGESTVTTPDTPVASDEPTAADEPDEPEEK